MAAGGGLAVSGSLEELAVLDVVQFVNHAHLSGALVLKSASGEAELYYRKGGLVHARLGDLTGIEVLVRIFDWTTGQFDFRNGADAKDETIRMDLHRAIMQALKIRDERKLEAERSKLEAKPVEPSPPSMNDYLRTLIGPLEFIRETAVFDATGILASAHRNGASDLSPVCKTLTSFIEAYPGGGLRRAILDDVRGTVILSGLAENRWLVVVAPRGVTLGAVSVGMGRLVAGVEAFERTKREAQRSNPAA